MAVEQRFHQLWHEAKFTIGLLDIARQTPQAALNSITHRNKLVGASIDVAANCNLRCKHCYLYEKDHVEEELTDAQFLDHLDQFRKDYPTIIHCTWVGGEPLYRRELVREGVKRFPLNWIITNGTIPINGKWTNNTAIFFP